MSSIGGTYQDIHEASRAVFFAFAEKKTALLEMALKKANLEDIFIELTEDRLTANPPTDEGVIEVKSGVSKS